MNATLDTTLGELLADPQAVAVIDQYLPGASANPLIGMVKGMSLRMIVAMPQAAMFGLTEKVANDILFEINKQV